MSYITERREAEKERRRAEIVDAAEALYSEIGWDATTIDEVARRARLSRALVYVYFKDKRDLHFAIVDRALQELRQRFEAAAGQHDAGIENVAAIGRAYVEFANRTPHYFDACSRFQAHRPESTDEDTNEAASLRAGRRVDEVLIASLTKGMEDGSVRSDLGDPVATALALWAFTHGMIQIASSKAAHLSMLGVDVAGFVEQSFALLRAALASKS
jgi:TetR/AcrR family transcriptional regulator